MKYKQFIYGMLSILSCLCYQQSTAQVFINELLAANISFNEDPDFGKTADWIELYNYSDANIDLSGYFLSDDEQNSSQWQIPIGTIIPAHGHLLFWADDENIGLHTNFKLSKSGETITLFSPTGEIVDALTYGEQSNNISYGRLVDASGEWGFFETPTPANVNNGFAFDGRVVYLPEFSKKGGFYTTTFQLELQSIEGFIRYTLDGSEPNENSLLYSSPISVDATTVVRAKVFQTQYIPSKTITHTYFFNENFEERALPVVAISTHPDNFWSADTGIYVQDFKPLWEHPINIELFENDGDNRAAFNEVAGIKINGNHSWQLPQKMMGIYFDNAYDKKNLDYPLFFDRDRAKFDNFSLRASGTDQSYTFIRDALVQRITQPNMDLDIQGYKPAAVYVNGQYLGLFNIRSRLDEQYIEHYFGEEEYDLIDNNGEIEEGDSLAFQQLFNLLQEDLSVENNFNVLTAVLDIDNLIDYFIAEIWSSNGSWGHNIKWWKPKTPTGKWRFLFKDLDRAMFHPSTNSFVYFSGEGIWPSGYEWARAILRQLFQNEAFKQRFVKRFGDHLFSTFHSDAIRPKVAVLQSTIETEIPYQIERWLGAESELGDAIPNKIYWDNQVARFQAFSELRSTFLWRDLQHFFFTPTVSSLSLICEPADAGQIYFNELLLPENKWTGLYFDETSFQLETKAAIGQQFEGWSLGSQEILITRQSEWKYLDDGSHLGENWRTEHFDDSNWNNGQAQFGYGDEDEITLVNYGEDEDNKFITTYFRKKFIIEDLESYTGQIIINLLIDDGAVFYLNGEEIRRMNMPAGEITAESLALKSISTNQEFDYTQLIIHSDLVKEGENTLAVEVHQESPNSSDISFDMDFIMVQKTDMPIFSNEALLSYNLLENTVLIAHFSPSEICTIPEKITSDMTLTSNCSPYYALGETTILPNVTLTIEPGVTIYMPDGASLVVKGDLQINGTEAASVQILPNPENSTATWGNLQFEHTTALSNLNHLTLIGASKGKHPIRSNAAIAAYYSNLNIQHLFIDNVEGQLLQTQYTDIQLSNSYLATKNGGKILYFQYGNAIIENCEIKGTNSATTTAILLEEMSNAMIRHNQIHQLLATDSKGIVVTKAAPSVFITANFIHNCIDKGILLKTKAQAMIQNNTFTNCKNAIGVKSQASAIIDQNTFYNNEICVKAFEKEVGEGGGEALIKNCILSNSSEQTIFSDEFSTLSIQRSLSDTDSIPNNLFVAPNFVHPTAYDFQLLPNSPALLAGQDEAGQPIDMGTNFHVFTANPEVQISAIHYHPPVDETAEFLDIYNPSSASVDLSNYSIDKGIDILFPAGFSVAPYEKVRLVKDISLFPNATESLLQWDAGQLSNDGETIRLKNAAGLVIDQVIYNDTMPWQELADGQGQYLSLLSSSLDNHFAESWEGVGEIINNLEPIEIAYHVQLSPNPLSHDKLTIISDVPIQEIVLYNALGQWVSRAEANFAQQFTLPLTGLGNGIYFIKINGAIVEKLVVQR